MTDLPFPPTDRPDELEQALRRAAEAKREEADIAADDSGASATVEDDAG